MFGTQGFPQENSFKGTKMSLTFKHQLHVKVASFASGQNSKAFKLYKALSFDQSLLKFYRKLLKIKVQYRNLSQSL